MSQFHVVQIHNPLDPRDCSRETRDLIPGKSLADMFPLVAVQQPMAYTINGRVISQAEMATSYPAAGDFVTVCPIPQGGSSKNILRLIAIIAVVVFAPYATTSLVGINGAAVLGATGVAAVTAGITIAGVALVNSMLPPPKPTGGSTGGSESSPSYGIDGAKNTSAEGVVVPLCYGQFRMAGNILNNYVVNDGDTQYLYMLINAGEGQVAAISEETIEINDQPIDSFEDYEVDLSSTGTRTQGKLKWFADTITPIGISQKIVDTYKFYTTSGIVDRLRIDVVAPSGLFYAKDDGSLGSTQVAIEIDYRLNGVGSWIPFTSTAQVASYSSAFVYNPVKVVDANGVETGATTTYVPNGTEYALLGLVYAPPSSAHITPKVVGYVQKVPEYGPAGTFYLKSNVRTAYRRSFMSPTIPQGVYEIRYRRTSVESTDTRRIDSVFISDVNEIVDEDIAYSHTALVALKIRLSDQLNGIPKVTYLHGGKLIRAWNETTNAWETIASANPAWIVMDILTNKRYGGGAAQARIDLNKFKDWAKFCDDNGYEFHGVFDTQSNIWDSANEVARCGHAQLITVGTRFSVTIERAEDPVMMFNVGNMIEGTFKETWLPMTDRANEIEVTYSDAADNYATHAIRLYDATALAAGAPQRTATVRMRGIVSAQRAYDEAQLLLNFNKCILRTIEFGAPLEAIACAPGDVILVQHDMPKWGDGGRLEASSTATVLNLDRVVTMEYGKTYQALVHFDSMMKATGTIHSISGTFVYLNSYDGSTAIKRLKVGSIDRRVASVITHPSIGGLFGVELDTVTGITGGATYELHDTNVMLTRGVTNPATIGSFVEVTTITVATLGTAPPQYSKWMFGESNKVAKPFRVKSISGDQDYRRDITALEYNASVYDPAGAVPTVNYSALGSKYVQPVTIDGVTEEIVQISSTTFRSRLTIAYRSTAASYLDAEVFLSRNDGPYVSVGRSRTSVSVNGTTGEQLDFRVVARDRRGNIAPVTTSPNFPYTVTGTASNIPPNVTGLFYSSEPNVGIQLEWDQVAGGVDFYEIRKGGTTWETASYVAKVKSTTYAVGPKPTAPVNYFVKAVNYEGGASVLAEAISISTTIPFPPDIEYTLDGAFEIISWTIPTSNLTVDRYEIRQGATWATATKIDTIKGTSFRRQVKFVGMRTYWVAAIDIAGNVGTPASLDVGITGPGIVTAARSEIVDNNALLFWNPPTSGSLPIERYEVRKGASYALGTNVGSNGNSTFAAVFEQAGGDFMFWVAAIDTAGNVSTPVGISAKVSAPPDYVLRALIQSTFTGTKTNFFQEGSSLVGPVDTSQDWSTHFSSNGWSTPQDQIDAGFPVYIEPSLTSGSYSEVFDYGATLSATTVTADLASEVVTGAVTTSCQIAYKLNIGDPWTNGPAGATSIVATNFRYVQVTFTFTCTAGANLIRLDAFSLKLANKLKTDSGTGTIMNAATGVFVPFAVPFISANTPIMQPDGTTPLIPVVDYAGGPNPTGATYYLYNTSGVKQTGSFSWTVRGL